MADEIREAGRFFGTFIASGAIEFIEYFHKSKDKNVDDVMKQLSLMIKNLYYFKTAHHFSQNWITTTVGVLFQDGNIEFDINKLELSKTEWENRIINAAFRKDYNELATLHNSYLQMNKKIVDHRKEQLEYLDVNTHNCIISLPGHASSTFSAIGGFIDYFNKIDSTIKNCDTIKKVEELRKIPAAYMKASKDLKGLARKTLDCSDESIMCLIHIISHITSDFVRK